MGNFKTSTSVHFGLHFSFVRIKQASRDFTAGDQSDRLYKTDDFHCPGGGEFSLGVHWGTDLVSFSKPLWTKNGDKLNAVSDPTYSTSRPRSFQTHLIS